MYVLPVLVWSLLPLIILMRITERLPRQRQWETIRRLSMVVPLYYNRVGAHCGDGMLL